MTGWKLWRIEDAVLSRFWAEDSSNDLIVILRGGLRATSFVSKHALGHGGAWLAGVEAGLIGFSEQGSSNLPPIVSLNWMQENKQCPSWH